MVNWSDGELISWSVVLLISWYDGRSVDLVPSHWNSIINDHAAFNSADDIILRSHCAHIYNHLGTSLFCLAHGFTKSDHQRRNFFPSET